MNDNVTVATFKDHIGAEQAVKALRHAGIDFDKISVVGRDYETREQPLGYFNMGDRARFFGKFGAFWGSLAGILLGAFVMVIPVFGHIIVLGPLAATVVSGIEGAALGGAGGALVGAMSGLGVPKDSALRFQTAIAAGEFLLMVHGTSDDVELARSVLEQTGAATVETHGTAPAFA